jgi:hypothetical protein
MDTLFSAAGVVLIASLMWEARPRRWTRDMHRRYRRRNCGKG